VLTSADPHFLQKTPLSSRGGLIPLNKFLARDPAELVRIDDPHVTNAAP